MDEAPTRRAAGSTILRSVRLGSLVSDLNMNFVICISLAPVLRDRSSVLSIT